MKGPRAIGLGLLLGLSCAAFFMPDAAAQMGRNGSGGRNKDRDPLPDQSASPRNTDVEGADAVDLFSRLCVSTRGDRTRAIGIVGDGDAAIEKMSEPLLRGMENGQSGGVGWIIRMPLGDRILLEFPPDGSCIVRAPRAEPGRIEAAFHNLLDQYAASGQFDVKRSGEMTKSFDSPGKAPASGKDAGSGGDRHRDDNKLKVHFTAYTMHMPDTGKVAELGLATTDSRTVNIQATLTYIVKPDTGGTGRP